jgi:hypothetical protein
VTQRAVVDRLILLAADSLASPEVRAMADLKLSDLRTRARDDSRSAGGPTMSVEERAHLLAIATDLTQWLDRREIPRLTLALIAPPGDPF